MSNVIIEFQHVDKKFGGIHAVNDVSFSIDQGEIHTILGENGAGKSTLLNMLSGLYMPTSGKIIYKGKAVQINNPQKAKELGIATVFQELKLCPNLSVTQNIFLGREIKSKAGTPNWKVMKERAKELNELGLAIDVSSKIRNLSAAQRQLVEISKAMFGNPDVLILDEPTSSLTFDETAKLFKTVRILKERGVTIIFISHRMQEVFEISDRISIMRNGKYLATYVNGEISQSKIVSMISGKEEENEKTISFHTAKHFSEDSPIALEVKKLNSGKLVNDISFQLHEHEMLGFYGLQGAGRTELMETIYGLRKTDSGEVRLYDQSLNGDSVRKRMEKGLAMVSEDRKGVGLFMNFDVMNNIAATHDADITNKAHFLDKSQMIKIAEQYKGELSVRCETIRQKVSELSGGNQQKVSVAKSLSTHPKVLIMDEPTRGVDIGAKKEIFELLHKLCDDKENPMSIIVVSSELAEVVSECDRVIVIHRGCIAGELDGDEITKDAILQLAFNGASN